MKSIGIIPARYNSTRFPGKPLALIHGKTMIERVFNRASGAATLSKVIVATDDIRIYDHVLSFGGHAVMTHSAHISGTERCAEAVAALGSDFELVVNIQGDQPYIHPGQIDQLVKGISQSDDQIATLVKKITSPDELETPHLPKVVVSEAGKALYFSRRAIPFCKEKEIASGLNNGLFLKHVGIYAFQVNVLKKIVLLKESKLEKSESLEQLRWLEHGYPIQTFLTDYENIAVDIPEDILLIEKKFNSSE
jgi:3-deoxy-manno-octulosonate cytidylyltransferase (CMP-KDO synthetase)